jgi:eukaryotic-like serine/threonine-protein kinase
VNTIPYVQRREPGSRGGFSWGMAAGAVVLLIIGVGAGSAYLPGRGTREPEKAAAPAPAAATKPVESSKVGTLALTTQPAGARVLLDGKPVGETPLTLADLPPGKHALTLVTASGSVKKLVRIEGGKTTTLEVPIYSGWIAVFAPIPLDIAENGRAIGTTDQGRLMLSPGLHQLTLSNKRLSYKTVQVVDIEPGEERSISVQPTGELSVNAVPWAEVWMAGKKIGETPIAGLQVPLGTHDLVLKNPQFPERHITVTVTGAPGAIASTDFTK